MRPVCYLLTDLCATGSSGWTRSAGRSCRRMLLVPLIVVAAAWGSAQPSALRVIELHQGLVRYELSLWPTLRAHNCGVCRPTVGIRGTGNPSFG
jgi:hypothetical protein